MSNSYFKKLYSFLIAFCCITIVHADLKDQKPTTEEINNTTIYFLKQWLKDKQSNSTMVEKSTLDTIYRQAKWHKAKEITASDGKSLVFIPITNNRIGIEFFYDAGKKIIDSCNIVKISSHNIFQKSNPLLAIQAYYEKVILKTKNRYNYSGQLQTFSLKGSYLYSYEFLNGSIVSRGLLAPVNKSIKHDQFSQTKKENCREWAHYTILNNGYISIDYTFWMCICDGTIGINLSNGGIEIKQFCIEKQDKV